MPVLILNNPIISRPSTKPITSLSPTISNRTKTLNFTTSTSFIRRHPSPKTSSFTLPKATPVQKHVYPDPIPAFAVYETKKYREEVKRKLCNERETFGDELDAVLDTCTKLFNQFLHNEYGGPGTLIVEPFTNMFTELKQKKLPGANLAARASLLWAQNYLDRDWEIYNSKSP